ncbi:MAG: hypothetical protein K2L02_02650 [Clostridia bacterium]|nr:hypothetical protein [Clostridia bacterium]
MKKAFITILACLMAILALTLTACGDNKGETVLELTYRNSDCAEEKSIYFNEDYESVTLNAKIEVEDGLAKMQILDKQEDKVVWEKTADKTEDFDIELKNVVANTEYYFHLEVEHAKYIHLLVTSPVKLVKNKEKPEVQSKT